MNAIEIQSKLIITNKDFIFTRKIVSEELFFENIHKIYIWL